MKAVIFIETKEGIQFKCDTFWSKSDKPRNAKVYSDNPTELKGWLQSVLPHNIYKDMVDKVKERYNGAKLGYFTPEDNLFKNSFILNDDVSIKDLGKPTYLWTIKMNSVSDWIIKKEYESKDEKSSIDVDTKSLGEFIDYRISHRDDVIGDILKEKESD